MSSLADTQQGFAFGDTEAPSFAEDPIGTWLEPQFTSAAYRAHFAGAQVQLPRLDPALQQLFGYGLARAAAELDDLASTIEEGEGAFSLPSVDVEVTVDQWRTFVDGCSARRWPAAECRTRQAWGYTVHAAHVAGVGSLLAHEWADSRAVEFVVGRDPELAASYLDACPTWALPAAVWRPFYVGHRLAESHDEPAPVAAMRHQGRLYVVSSSVYRRGLSTAHAWTVVPLAEWRGPTYSYRSQCGAWDDGRKERGDCRGLVVSLAGQRCVLESYAEFIDEDDTPAPLADELVAEDDEQDEGEAIDGDA